MDVIKLVRRLMEIWPLSLSWDCTGFETVVSVCIPNAWHGDDAKGKLHLDSGISPHISYNLACQ